VEAADFFDPDSGREIAREFLVRLAVAPAKSSLIVRLSFSAAGRGLRGS
jgi:hypothetical protein